MQLTAPLIVQSDLEILIEVANPDYISARDAIAPFTELVKSPEHLHTYRISRLSLWNAASVGLTSDEVIARLEQWSKYPLPPAVVHEVREYMGRYGRLRLIPHGEGMALESDDSLLIEEIVRMKELNNYLQERVSSTKVCVVPATRGLLKMALTRVDMPVEDLVGYVEGEHLDLTLRKEQLLRGGDFTLRDYQAEAAEIFYSAGAARGGSGVVVLPCGSGKTIVGIAALALLQAKTLILTPNITAARQWIRELIDKTSLTEAQVKEYSGESKEIGDVTVATYQIITRRTGVDETGEPIYGHFSLFNKSRWGLIIYDEVHLLPAPVFRVSAEMQATRRLGLTATLVREDGREEDVFSLIGPKKYDLPWKKLEVEGWIAPALCYEVRLSFAEEQRMEYVIASPRDKIRIASCNPSKVWVVEELMEKHSGVDDRVLVIGQYLDQLSILSKKFEMPLITGQTPVQEREKLYEKFRSGEIVRLMVSKVANFAIDLPDANVLIQVSGTFGSRQEEAQRLGRILRPKSDGGSAYFYSVVTRDSREQEFSMNRQLFLAEQGYQYEILNLD